MRILGELSIALVHYPCRASGAALDLAAGMPVANMIIMFPECVEAGPRPAS
jgi:hypothetical protein